MTAGEAEGLAPGQLQPAGISTAAILNPAATAGHLQLPPGVCAIRQLTAKDLEAGPFCTGKAHHEPLRLAQFQTQTPSFTLPFSVPFLLLAPLSY